VVRYNGLGARTWIGRRKDHTSTSWTTAAARNSKQFAFEAGIGYKTRPDNKYAKAGNINAALKSLTSPFVAVFDCDNVPRSQLPADDHGAGSCATRKLA